MNTTKSDGREHTNPATLRTSDGEARSILTAADRHSDNSGKVVDASPIAPQARQTRRGVLMNSIVSVASLASATALAPAGAAAVLEIDPSGNDAKLLALGAQLDSVEEEWLALRVEEDERDPEAPHPDPNLTRYSANNDRAFPLADKILAQQPATLAGLKVQVRAMALINQELFDESDKHDPDPTNRLRPFLRVLCSFLKITPAPLQAALLRAGVDVNTFRSTPVLPAPEVDPIFAAIAAYLEADKAHATAVHLYSEAEGAFRDEFGTMTPSAVPKDLQENMATIFGMLNPDWAYFKITTHKQIDEFLEMFGADVVESMHLELDRQTAIHNERVKPLDDESGRACHAAADAGRDLFNTVPTTSAGLLALLRLVTEHECLVDLLDINENMEDLLDTMIAYAAGNFAAAA